MKYTKSWQKPTKKQRIMKTRKKYLPIHKILVNIIYNIIVFIYKRLRVSAPIFNVQVLKTFKSNIYNLLKIRPAVK
jgi:hypothetical protein